MTDLPTYVLERDFDAPRPLVWTAWTDPALFARWYGPGAETLLHHYDLRPGGSWRLEMRMARGSMFQRADIHQVLAPERLVFVIASTDAAGTIASSPQMPDWPRRLLTTVTFADAGQRTRMTLTWVPYQATEAEVACFGAAMAGMGRGWSAGMDVLAEILAERVG